MQDDERVERARSEEERPRSSLRLANLLDVDTEEERLALPARIATDILDAVRQRRPVTVTLHERRHERVRDRVRSGGAFRDAETVLGVQPAAIRRHSELRVERGRSCVPERRPGLCTRERVGEPHRGDLGEPRPEHSLSVVGREPGDRAFDVPELHAGGQLGSRAGPRVEGHRRERQPGRQKVRRRPELHALLDQERERGAVFVSSRGARRDPFVGERDGPSRIGVTDERDVEQAARGGRRLVARPDPPASQRREELGPQRLEHRPPPLRGRGLELEPQPARRGARAALPVPDPNERFRRAELQLEPVVVPGPIARVAEAVVADRERERAALRPPRGREALPKSEVLVGGRHALGGAPREGAPRQSPGDVEHHRLERLQRHLSLEAHVDDRSRHRARMYRIDGQRDHRRAALSPRRHGGAAGHEALRGDRGSGRRADASSASRSRWAKCVEPLAPWSLQRQASLSLALRTSRLPPDS